LVKYSENWKRPHKHPSGSWSCPEQVRCPCARQSPFQLGRGRHAAGGRKSSGRWQLWAGRRLSEVRGRQRDREDERCLSGALGASAGGWARASWWGTPGSSGAAGARVRPGARKGNVPEQSCVES